MAKVIALSGPVASGKTHRRTTDLELKDLPYVDIADVYREGVVDPRDAFSEALARVIEQIKNGVEVVVMEAAFLPGSYQREVLEIMSNLEGASVEYIEVYEVPKVRYLRIMSDYQSHPEREEYARARLMLWEMGY